MKTKEHGRDLTPQHAPDEIRIAALPDGKADPEQCERLEASVRSGPLRRELRFPYHPHVTVAHEVAEPLLDQAFDELASYVARFEVWGFSLFEPGGDGVWRPQRDFPLGDTLPGPVQDPAVSGTDDA